MPASVSERLADVKARIARACQAAGRSPDEVTLVAVTKYATVEQVDALLATGHRDLGESRVQQLETRAQHWAQVADIRWHMIGHLQRNKAKAALQTAHLIHSVDTLRLAEELQELAVQTERDVPILLEVNCSLEPQKQGVAYGAALHLAEQIGSMSCLRLAGLMTMAPLTEDTAVIRQSFTRLRELFQELRQRGIGGADLRHLSMGMTHDFELAIAEGATMARIGSALFGAEAP